MKQYAGLFCLYSLVSIGIGGCSSNIEIGPMDLIRAVAHSLCRMQENCTVEDTGLDRPPGSTVRRLP